MAARYPTDTCKHTDCPGLSHWRVHSYDDRGPQPAWSDRHGIYCLAHAQQRADELTPAWQERRAARRAANAAAHAAWLAQYRSRTA